MRLHELQEKRAAAVNEMRSLADRVEAEARDYSAEEDKRHSELKTSITSLDRSIERTKELQEAERAAPAIVTAGNINDGRYEDRARNFSIVKAILARCGEPVDAGFENELSAELRSRTGRAFNGIPVPDEAFAEQRTLTTGGDASALYPTQHRPDLFVDILRSQLVVARLGATYLDGLTGDQSIPRQIGSSTAQHVAEDAALTETDADFDDIELSPKTVGAMTSFSRRAMLNATPSVEALVRRDLSAVIAAAIDYQALFGDASGNTPTGVINQTGVTSLTLAGPTWEEVLAFVATVESADADLGTMGWALSPRAVAKFRTTLKVAGDAGGGFLMNEPGNLAGYGVATSTAVPVVDDAATVVFGVWNQLLIGRWSGIDLLANPYSDSAFPRGRVQVRAMCDYDVAVRHGEAFAYADDLGVGTGDEG